MIETLPLWIALAAAGIGAVYTGSRFHRLKQPLLIGGALGAAAGALGAQALMVPLNYCPFVPEDLSAAEAEIAASNPLAWLTVDVAFGIGLMAIGAAVLVVIITTLARWWLLRGQPSQLSGQPTAGVFKGRLLPLLFLSPTLVVLALFLYYPSLETFRLSTQLARLGARREAFVCVDNFTRLIGDADYLRTVLITLGMSFAIVVLGLALALFIAVIAFQPIKGARIYRTLLIWPYAISPVVAGIIFLLLFNPTGGIINYVLSNLTGGVLRIGWLNDPAWAPWAVILASVWKSLGFNILFYLAGLQNVPNDLKEAASIDGANNFQRFWRVVFPMLSPITFFLIITNITYAFFDTFGTIDYLTGGGPLRSTTTMMYQIYETGIANNDLGKAAAQSIVLFVMVIGLTVLQFRTTGERVNYGA